MAKATDLKTIFLKSPRKITVKFFLPFLAFFQPSLALKLLKVIGQIVCQRAGDAQFRMDPLKALSNQG